MYRFYTDHEFWERYQHNDYGYQKSLCSLSEKKYHIVIKGLLLFRWKTKHQVETNPVTLPGTVNPTKTRAKQDM